MLILGVVGLQIRPSPREPERNAEVTGSAGDLARNAPGFFFIPSPA